MDKVAEEEPADEDVASGVVGYGWAAGAHLTALSRDPERRGRRHLHLAHGRDEQGTGGGPADRGRRDLDELLARDDIDVIDICSRSNLHAAQAIAAARAGKHVIIEKPIALTVGELRGAQQAVARVGRADLRLLRGALLRRSSRPRSASSTTT